MYINFRPIGLIRPLSILEYCSNLSKCSISSVLNDNIQYLNKINSRRSRFFVTSETRGTKLDDTQIHSYFRRKETFSKNDSYEKLDLSVYNKLKYLSSNFEVSLDSICLELNYIDNYYSFFKNTPGYRNHSELLDGYIDITLANNDIYFDSITDIHFNKNENSILNRKLVPATHLPHLRYFKFIINKKMFESAQLLFDSNSEQLIKNLDGNQCLKLVEMLYLLNTSVAYKHICSILEKGCQELGNLSLTELVKLAICVRGYLDRDNSYLKHYLVRIGICLENKLTDSNEYSQKELIDHLLPLSLMQVIDHPIQWSVVSNYDVLNKITDGFEELDHNYQGKLLTILSSLESCPDVSNKYYKVYEQLINSLSESMNSVDYKVILNMMNVPILFHSFEVFRENLFSQTKTRWSEFPLNTLIYIYFKRKDDIPKEYTDLILNSIPPHLHVIEPKYISELFCCYLNEGNKTMGSMNKYRANIKLLTSTLLAKNISNVLMYLSINWKSKIDFYPNIIDRFNTLKKEKMINNQELLDVVLSMSLVGIHNSDVWTNVDLHNVVYQLPKNILVYLGYSFLITDMRDVHLWMILLDRIIYENKNVTPETYEVLKAAQILEFVPNEYNNKRFENLLKSSRSSFLARQSRQRYVSEVPYQMMFKQLGLNYYKDYLIDDLYEATYYIPEYKFIVIPVKNSVLHSTSGFMSGDMLLRDKVFHKLGYNYYFYYDKKWSKYYNEDAENPFWNIDGLCKSFSKQIKLNKYLKEKKKENKYLKTKSKLSGRVLKNTQSTSGAISRIKMLKNMVVLREGKK